MMNHSEGGTGGKQAVAGMWSATIIVEYKLTKDGSL
jgi:hypothetical protein